MDVSWGNQARAKFAIGRDARDLRGPHDPPTEVGIRPNQDGPYEWAESGDSLEALNSDPAVERRPRLDSFDDSRREPSASSPGAWSKRINQRTVLVALLFAAVVAVAPFAWNYLQSYESTDDAQIDGHIDPLSSRVDGTVVRVYPEDDDHVKRADLLVEIDPRDYEVAVEQAKAHLALALAQVASAQQDYAAALANVREADATNFRA